MAKKKKQSEHADKLAAEAAATPATKSPGKGAWRLMDKGSAIVAGLLAQRASVIAWRAVTGKKPPTSGRHPEVTTGEAVAWAVVGGAIIELVKVAVRRGTATYWVRSTGNLPPGMKPIVTVPKGNEKEPVLADPAPERASTKKKVSRRNRGR
ncbi:hypothetical protein C6I20_06165 [Aeromicrobium sp. A1-2]|uniref:DUF4235 domain-containing protein n=1 Tax=Aeromicrobium sp. A1-2 TaxID=2107713 RepID=UPI000E551019|nr:DUF4235 domain-containing protein [Aeromicrobium sp. A1-2]AXT84817.1 hypothetical protein C6I20_06165 [Aeromicrobium sp. A1-2]